ncbi:hypothetical protein BH10ACT4_BH10ACT4_11810 [soil metagenome]
MTEILSGDDVGGSGFSLDDLSDYLDRGREPAILAIDGNAECQAMLATLERVGALSRDIVVQDARDNPEIEESWLQGLLTSISREVRAGRDIPLSSSEPNTRLTITEGAVHELVRAAGDTVEGVLVGRCTLDGDLSDPNAAVRVSLTISVVLSAPIVGLAAAVRERVYSELLKHTELTIESVDVTVTDAHSLVRPIEED